MRVESRTWWAVRLAACVWMAASAGAPALAQPQSLPQSVPPSVWPTAGWTQSSPEAQGMDSEALAALIDFGRSSAMDSLLVTRHGRLVVDAYYAPFGAGLKHALNSTTKGVVGTLTGMAIQDGLLSSREQPVLDLFPEHGPVNADASKKAITLGHLLDMTSGLDWKEKLDDSVPETMLQMTRSANWQGFVLDRPMAAAPGTVFNYNSGNTHLLSAILARKTGGGTLAYAQERLFKPLGIQDVRWNRDPQGVEIGGWGLYLHPRDMAKLGYLYVRKGQWEGRQLLPAAWVDQVFQASVDMGAGIGASFRYANGWWTMPDKRAFMMVGFNRQLVIVLPDLDIVAVATGRRHYPFAGLIDRITASARSASPMPENDAASALLAQRVREASVEVRSAVEPTPALAAEVSGRRWQFERNLLGVKSLVLDLDAANPTYELVHASLRSGAPSPPVRGPIGLDGYYRVASSDGPSPVAVKGQWLDARSFQVISRALSDGDVSVFTLRFDGPAVDVSFENNRGFKTQIPGKAAP